ncbi:PASTA domain-containing protein [Streptomyces sp. 24-1644]|uniref:PASTA domain-containing protein n=1 Tax=Streptomyces sp. 24-1644 TaxID=3457315 RepID=UPI003FA7DE09
MPSRPSKICKHRLVLFLPLAMLALTACTSTLPDMAGRELQAAQDEAQEAGFSNLGSEDALGQGRAQVWDRNWVVCDQDPEPGEADPEQLVTFTVVKTEEQCPAGTPGFKLRPGDEMPDLTGMTLFDADEVLVLVNGVEDADATGQGRSTLAQARDWKVCSQEPAPGELIEEVISQIGEEVEDPAVTLHVVKTEEKCP